jgi:integrative and conjugative element protein (TIGR02256 family)
MCDMTTPRDLIFYRSGGAAVKIAPPALAVMLSFRQTTATAKEAGGILLGRYIIDCQDVVVDEATAPTRSDRRTRFTFHRDAISHQRIIDERWHASRGRFHYLGEWHTHPETSPTPSSVDLADWRRRLRTDRFDANSLLFIIVGIRNLRIWEGRGHEIHELTLDNRGSIV